MYEVYDRLLTFKIEKNIFEWDSLDFSHCIFS